MSVPLAVERSGLRFQARIGWWAKLSFAAQRLRSLFAVAFDVAVLWALLPVAT